MKYLFTIGVLLSAFYLSAPLMAACPLDHITVGCNLDSEPNTPDDYTLHLDVSKKYKRSTLEGDWPQDYWKNRYYPMTPGWGGDCLLGEPGLDFVDDPNGIPQQAFDLRVECVSISDALTVLDDDMNALIEQTGESFSYTSSLSSTHVHLTYHVTAGEQERTQWFTFRIYDALGNYAPSEDCTIVFCRPPIAGDICVDRFVDILDLEKLTWFWLANTDQTQLNIAGLAAIDVFDGADIDRDYAVNLSDFVWIAYNWLVSE